MCGKYENINDMTVTQDRVYNSILSLHQVKRMVCLVKIVNLVQMVFKLDENGTLGQNDINFGVWLMVVMLW